MRKIAKKPAHRRLAARRCVECGRVVPCDCDPFAGQPYDEADLSDYGGVSVADPGALIAERLGRGR